MNLMPLLGFIMRRGTQVSALIASGNRGGNSHLAVDLLEANLQFIKKNFPALAADGLADDVLSTAKEVLTPDTPIPSA